MQGLLKRNYSITEGKMFLPILKYTLPIIFTNVLQLLYTSADMYVLGQFSGDPNAIGAVGSVGSLINLFLGLFIGLGAGVSVILAQGIGSKNDELVQKTVHTSFLLAIILGAFITVVGYLMMPTMLKLMGSTEEFFEGAKTYAQIYFLGSIANILYNFQAGIIRSKGDSVSPLIFSSVSGVINFILNLVFVIVFNLGILGVAVATIISQYVAAFLTSFYLIKQKDACKLYFKKLKIDKNVLIQFIKIGLPAGLQGMMFSISNVILQSGFYSLGSTIVNANSATSQVDNYIYQILNSFYFATLTFASQNYGARKMDRVKKTYFYSIVYVVVIGIVIGTLSYVFSDTLIGIFDSHPEVISEGKTRLFYIALPYFLCGMMDISTGMIRSIGHPLSGTIVTFIGCCLFRSIWVFTVFQIVHTPDMLYIVYPISWTFTFVFESILFFYYLKKSLKNKV